MPIFITPRHNNDDDLSIMHELEAKPAGSNDDNDDDQQGGGNPTDAPEDYTLDDEGEDQTPEEGENNVPDEGTEANGGQADSGDDSFGGGDMGSSDEGGGDSGGGEGMEGGGEDGDDSFGGDNEEEGGEGEGDDGDNDDYTSDSDGGDDEDELKSIENDIFAKYDPKQRAIMSKALKKRFNSLIELSSDLTDRINEIPKAMEHIKAIEFVTDKLDEMQRMVADYLYSTFDTRSYTENEIFFQQLMITYNQISELVGKIPTIKPSKPTT